MNGHKHLGNVCDVESRRWSDNVTQTWPSDYTIEKTVVENVAFLVLGVEVQIFLPDFAQASLLTSCYMRIPLNINEFNLPIIWFI